MNEVKLRVFMNRETGYLMAYDPVKRILVIEITEGTRTNAVEVILQNNTPVLDFFEDLGEL